VFTGSTAVGKRVMAAAAADVKRVTLELGGNNANIVFADADISRAARSAGDAVFDNAGQDCCARSRILVQDSVFDDFVAEFAPTVRDLRVGDPTREDTQMGPLVSAEHHARVRRYLTTEPDIVGQCPKGNGFYLAPSAYLSVRPEDPIWTDEVFGPVVAVMPFRDEADAIAKANATVYGLSGSIWTGDVGRALRVSRAVEAGNLSVNSHASVRYWSPFGGFKQSGLGREGGRGSFEAYTELKTVMMPLGHETM
ncbi:MAG: aldehyde dehydrogenase family protein, partial [Stackebrandtia sp.]